MAKERSGPQGRRPLFDRVRSYRFGAVSMLDACLKWPCRPEEGEVLSFEDAYMRQARWVFNIFQLTFAASLAAAKVSDGKPRIALDGMVTLVAMFGFLVPLDHDGIQRFLDGAWTRAEEFIADAENWADIERAVQKLYGRPIPRELLPLSCFDWVEPGDEKNRRHILNMFDTASRYGRVRKRFGHVVFEPDSLQDRISARRGR